MEVQYKSSNGGLVVNFDVKDQTALFEEIASFQQVFDDRNIVIKNKPVPSTDVQFFVREVDGNKYFEKRYVGPDKELWGFKMQFGQHKKGGGLFPRQFLDEEEKLTHEDGGNGWRRWKKDASKPASKPSGDASTEKSPF